MEKLRMTMSLSCIDRMEGSRTFCCEIIDWNLVGLSRSCGVLEGGPTMTPTTEIGQPADSGIASMLTAL